MSLATQRAAEAAATVRLFVPSFSIVSKADKWYHRAIGRVWPGYLDKWTTFGYEAARPPWKDSEAHSTQWVEVLHEGRHALQAKRWTRLGLVLAYVLPWARRRIEIEAYKVTVAVRAWAGLNPDLDQIASWAGGFTWEQAKTRNELVNWLNDLNNGEALDAYLTMCRDLAWRFGTIGVKL